MQLYTFRGTLDRVIDGDTIDCHIDVGFGLKTHQRLRFHGINTPELRSRDEDERSRAVLARDFVERWLEGKNLYIQTYKSDVFGRYLARIYAEGECLNDVLVEHGLARPFLAERSLVD